MKEDVVARVFYTCSAKFAVRRHFWVEAPSVFARGGVIGEGAGHTAGGLNVIGREHQEEALDGLVADVGFKQSTLPFDGDPTAPFVRLGFHDDAPMSAHIPFEFPKEIRAEDFDGSHRT